MIGATLQPQGRSSNASAVPTLADLISDRKAERGWTYARLQELSDDRITSQRWQQLATGVRLREFPEPATIQAIADAVSVDVTSVVLAIARSLGLPIRREGSDLAAMLPPAAYELSSSQRDAVLAVVRAMKEPKTSKDDSEIAGVTSRKRLLEHIRALEQIPGVTAQDMAATVRRFVEEFGPIESGADVTSFTFGEVGQTGQVGPRVQEG